MKLLISTLLILFVSACAFVPVEDYGSKAGTSSTGGSTLVCHKGKKTLDLPPDAVRAHLDHGDSRGPC